MKGLKGLFMMRGFLRHIDWTRTFWIGKYCIHVQKTTKVV